MSNVVAFKPERTGRTAGRRHDGGVQILFFTGVRYMREEAPVTLTGPERTAGSAAITADDVFTTERLKA